MLDKTNTQWPPDPMQTYMLREQLLDMYAKEPSTLTDAKAYYEKHPGDFVNTWCDTYDPRNAFHIGRSVRMPLILFPRQWDLFEFMQNLVENQCNGLIEKSRDMGATWCAGGFSVANFLFARGSSIGWGSRKEALVDRGGDIDSIFEKLRYLLRSVPPCFYPRGFDPDNMPHMKIVNPIFETSITEIGRAHV